MNPRTKALMAAGEAERKSGEYPPQTGYAGIDTTARRFDRSDPAIVATRYGGQHNEGERVQT